MSIPYAGATTGTKAREEITKVLRGFGCESIGFMDDYEKHEVLLAFTHRGRQVQLPASAKGWAALWLKANPYSYRCRRSRVEYA
jgi:thiamine biosynthesis lipoprotein ApbE